MVKSVSTEWLSDLGSNLAANIKWGLFSKVKPQDADSDAPTSGASLASQAEARVVSDSTPDFQERLEALKKYSRDLQKLSRETMADAMDAFASWGLSLIPIKDMVSLEDLETETNRLHDLALKGSSEAPENLNHWLRSFSGKLLNLSQKFHPDHLVSAYHTDKGHGAVIRMPASDAIREGSKALLLALSRAGNDRIFEQINAAKKSLRKRKNIFDDASSFGASLEEFEGGDENIILRASAQILAYDRNGAIPDAIKLIAKCAAHLDGGFTIDAGRIFAVLTGAPELEKENRFRFSFSDEHIRQLVQARCLALTAIAASDLRKQMLDNKVKLDSKGNEIKPLESARKQAETQVASLTVAREEVVSAIVEDTSSQAS